MPIFLENFSQTSCEKLCTRSPLGLNHPCLSTSISTAKKYDGWWNKLDCFYNTSACWKTH